jgi:hypothetical protein
MKMPFQFFISLLEIHVKINSIVILLVEFIDCFDAQQTPFLGCFRPGIKAQCVSLRTSLAIEVIGVFPTLMRILKLPPNRENGLYYRICNALYFFSVISSDAAKVQLMQR